MGWKRGWGTGLGLVLTSVLALAQPSSQPATEASPGTINYVEGQSTLNGEPLTHDAVQSVRLRRGQVLETTNGNVELLLTPGVFLRLGNDSSLRMISPGLANTEVALLHGRAMLEADELYKQNNLKIVVDDTTTRIQKRGLYEFDANQPAAMVFEGQARVFDDGHKVKVKGGHELLLADTGRLKAQEFDKKAAEQEPIYRWSRLRSEYESEANTEMARSVYLYGGWYGPGWYWDPYWGYYSFLPGYEDFWGPFGYPFYGPGDGFAIGIGHSWGGDGYYGRGEHFEHGGHAFMGRGDEGFRGGDFDRGGFRGGSFEGGGDMHAEGFHDGGGFHGGEGFHGGGGRRR